MEAYKVKSRAPKSKLFFAADNLPGTAIVPNADEKVMGGRVYWGADDMYPVYLHSLYQRCSIMQSVIDGTSEYISGNGITNIHTDIARYAQRISDNGETLIDVLNKAIWSIQLYGGIFMLMTLSNDRSRVYLNVLDPQMVRLTPDLDTGIILRVRNGRLSRDGDKYPIFKDWNSEVPEQSIFYYGGKNIMGYYPSPRYGSAITSIDTLSRIEDYFNSLVRNNFTLSGILEVPTDGMSDEEKKKAEKGIKEKYTGERAAGGLMVRFAAGMTDKASYTAVHANDLDKQYTEVSRSTSESVYAAFRAVPALFGLMTATTGFSQQEFTEAFTLYNTAIIQPARKQVTDIFAKVFNVSIPFEFEPLPMEVQVDQSSLAQTIGAEGTRSIMEIVSNSAMGIEQRRGLIKILFDLEDKQIDTFLPIIPTQNV